MHDVSEALAALQETTSAISNVPETAQIENLKYNLLKVHCRAADLRDRNVHLEDEIARLRAERVTREWEHHKVTVALQQKFDEARSKLAQVKAGALYAKMAQELEEICQALLCTIEQAATLDCEERAPETLRNVGLAR